MLGQDGKVIGYAGKTLSSVERRYSQIEREALAIAWDCHHVFAGEPLQSEN